jgi:hypothetical protein
MSGTTFMLVVLGLVALAIWAVYYFQFSDRATTRLVERLMSQPHTGPQLHSDFVAVVTNDGIACEHSHRPREFIRWADVREITIRRTADGPWSADLWVLFVGESGGCSVPTEAQNFDAVMKSFERFSGFDHSCFLDDSKSICWKRHEAYA